MFYFLHLRRQYLIFPVIFFFGTYLYLYKQGFLFLINSDFRAFQFVKFKMFCWWFRATQRAIHLIKNFDASFFFVQTIINLNKNNKKQNQPNGASALRIFLFISRLGVTHKSNQSLITRQHFAIYLTNIYFSNKTY